MPGRATATRCPAVRRVDLAIVDLDAANAHFARHRVDAEHVARSDPSRPESSRRDGPDAAQAEHTIDVEPRRRFGPLAFDGGAGQSSAQLVQTRPVFALTATTSEPGTSSARFSECECELVGLDSVGLRHGDNTAIDAEQPEDREVLVRLRPCALARVDDEQEKVDARCAPATIVRTKRSCPGTSTSESRRPSGRSSGA